MKTNPKIVTFERSAAYVHHRAMKNRRDNNPIDALELMRHAVEHSPENNDYRLDLAELYCEMGCHTQSNRILLDMLSAPDAPSECYYGLALNQLGMNRPEAARRALKIYQQHAENAEYLEDAINLRNEIDYFEDISRLHDRKKQRAMRVASKACDALQADQPERAVRLFERSFSLAPDQTEMRAVYALALKLVGRTDEALENAAVGVSGEEASVRALCTAAQVYTLCGMRDRARELAARAAEGYCEENELMLLILTMGELGMDRAAADKLRLSLQDTPHNRALLHMRAVALHRIGASDDQAAAFWKRILRIDPDDTVAAYYVQAAADGRLAEVDPMYPYEVPDGEYRRRLADISETLAAGADCVNERWTRDRDFRNLLVWAVSNGNESCCRAALLLMATVRDESADGALREIMYRGDVPIEARMNAMLFRYFQGMETDRLMPPDVNPGDGLLPDAEDILADMPVGERQLVRLAADILENKYGYWAEPALALMWRAYRIAARDRNDPLVRTEEAAAALAGTYLMQHGENPNVYRLAKEFHCNMRRMEFYGRRMEAAMNIGGGSDENH